jgi:hypothetical protein
MDIDSGQIYELLCKVHGDIGELKGMTTGFKDALEAHIEDDKRVIRAVYDTQIAPVAAKVDELRLVQAQQRGRTIRWGWVASFVGALAGAAATLAAPFIKGH